MRLDKWLADAGVGTRSEVKKYIRAVQLYEITIEHLTGKQVQEK